MNVHNHNFTKSVFLASIIVISIGSLGFLLPIAYAEHPPGFDTVTKFADSPLVVPNQMFSIRDIDNQLDQVDANGDPLVTTSVEIIRSTAHITVTDADANLDSDGIDKVLATLTSTGPPIGEVETELEETGDDTGIFTGTVKISAKPTTDDNLHVTFNSILAVVYDPETQGVGRAKFSFSYDTTGFDPGPPPTFPNFPDGTETVIMKDVIVNDECPVAGFPGGIVLLTHPIDFQAPDVSARQVKVTIAATNAVHSNWAAFDTNLLKIIYKPPGGVWEDLTQGDTSEHDITAGTHTGTITNVEQPSTALTDKDNVAQPGGTGDVSGQYAIGAQIGCPGGGGGGLVRPSLVVNALAGAGVLSSLFGGGSSGGGSAPSVQAGSVSSPDESIGFEQQGITVNSDNTKESSFEQTQIVNTGDDLTFSFDIIEDGGMSNLQHATMYFFMGNKVDLNKRYDISDNDASIMFDKSKSVHVNDPNGYFEKADFEIVEKDMYNMVLKYDISFAKSIDTASFVLRTWDTTKHSSDKIFHDALVVESSSDKNELLEDSIPSFLDTLNENELTKDETITKTGFPGIPLWVKNNALWWHEKQIDDSDFVAGIQYMINEEIITMPETEVTSSTSKNIPVWISNVAGYWSSDEITDAEFIQAMQWLVSNGVMEVV